MKPASRVNVVTSEGSILWRDREAGESKRKGGGVKSQNSSLQRSESTRDSQIDLWTQVVLTSQTVVAGGFSTWNFEIGREWETSRGQKYPSGISIDYEILTSWFDSNSVAWLYVENILSDSNNDASTLMT